MYMFKYVMKRIGLMLLITFCIMTISFVLIKLLQPEVTQMGAQAKLELARREALGYNKPILEQYAIYLKNFFTNGELGVSWRIDYMKPVGALMVSRMAPTLILNIISILISVPLGILFGIWAALKKNKATDHTISVAVMIFISVPSYVVAFLLQYILGFKLGIFPLVAASLNDAGGSWLSPVMIHSLVMPILSLSFGSIAGFARFTRAELTECLTSEYMLLARTKGLTRAQATRKHALKNAMVPILPMIIATLSSLFGGAMITEQIFAINGMGSLMIRAISLLDYDVFVGATMFYTLIGLSASLLVDLSYGFLDPRIRMGAR